MDKFGTHGSIPGNKIEAPRGESEKETSFDRARDSLKRFLLEGSKFKTGMISSEILEELRGVTVVNEDQLDITVKDVSDNILHIKIFVGGNDTRKGMFGNDVTLIGVVNGKSISQAEAIDLRNRYTHD